MRFATGEPATTLAEVILPKCADVVLAAAAAADSFRTSGRFCAAPLDLDAVEAALAAVDFGADITALVAADVVDGTRSLFTRDRSFAASDDVDEVGAALAAADFGAVSLALLAEDVVDGTRSLFLRDRSVAAVDEDGGVVLTLTECGADFPDGK